MELDNYYEEIVILSQSNIEELSKNVNFSDNLQLSIKSYYEEVNSIEEKIKYRSIITARKISKKSLEKLKNYDLGVNFLTKLTVSMELKLPHDIEIGEEIYPMLDGFYDCRDFICNRKYYKTGNKLFLWKNQKKIQ